ncbi:mediator of RNA polymerase II transcription subunit 1-domain-containing protein [Achaetomium macrosporum]|uniref:Mediator of RNA polymerase II transcription subunit 1 n=1 Tax=Achaetomium macrosporum TaxID=79813 RepID=A0AAN7C9S0_9PEZI|nr:mediator of RNA polymerase II transcription subunit 1-domain-containing protein [Achaetomium macrosporum]
MSTPKNSLSQQGKTPSQPHHGAAATPQVSTPFSMAQAALSPHGPRSSPQQVKKSPAAMTSVTMGRSNSSVPVNFESPSAAAALEMGSGLDINLRNLVQLGRANDDERARRLDAVIAILGRNKGLVSEAGLERLAKKLELEFIWENSMDSSDKRTLIVAGSALELVIEFSNNVVQSVTLSFPDSAEIVNKHAKSAGEILFKDLRLREYQSPLTKSMERFAANFERLAVLDKLSINPGLNLYEAVAGIYESLSRLHAWELRKLRQEPSLAGRPDEYLENLVLCTRCGKPTMNARGRVGMALEYWKERRLQPLPGPELAPWAEDHERTWCILIGCAPLRQIGVSPVRISDKWIGPNVEKGPLPDELHTPGPVIDWLEPESTFLPESDQIKVDPMQPDAQLLGPRLPEVVFHAAFSPPVHIPLSLWQQMQELGCIMDETSLKEPVSFDSLVIPFPPGKSFGPEETRIVSCNKETVFASPEDPSKLSWRSHANTLAVHKEVLCRTLTEMTFSHPQQLVTILPFLRQYVFLAELLKQSFIKEAPDRCGPLEGESSTTKTTAQTEKTTTNHDDFDDFTAKIAKQPNRPGDSDMEQHQPLHIDISLTLLPVPRLQIVFPFREHQAADVTLEIQENGHVSVVAQDVLDESNVMAPNGRQRRVEDIGALLEYFEDIGKWVEFIRTRWA